MKPKNPSFCYSLYCNRQTIPFYTLLLLGFIGFILAIIYEYGLLVFYELEGYFPGVCIAGIHFHHLYLGVIILIIALISFLFVKSHHRLWIGFFIGLGLGLITGDIISHLLYDPFVIYC